MAATDCLNFGNPEKLDVYYTLEHAVRGIAEACLVFETPVVSGNVSLYNETAERPIYPTPVIGMLGILEDASTALRSGFEPNRGVFLLGATLDQGIDTLAGSEYLEAEHGLVAGLPRIDLQAERRLQQLVLRAHGEGLLASAHDCGDGGLAVAVAEGAILGGQGFRGGAEFGTRLDTALFGEGQGRIVVSVNQGSAERLQQLAGESGVPITRLGETVTGDGFTLGPVTTTVTALRDSYESFV